MLLNKITMKTLKSLFKNHRAVEYSPKLEYYVEPMPFADRYGLYIAMFFAAAGTFFVCWVAVNQSHF